MRSRKEITEESYLSDHRHETDMLKIKLSLILEVLLDIRGKKK